jgi:hypothetical protein
MLRDGVGSVAHDQSEERGVGGARDRRGSGASGVGGARDDVGARSE